MENIFKFKKAKKMVGEFDSDDQHEWCLLTKPQIGDVTLFVHFHKLWLVTEVPEIEADEANNIKHQDAVVKMPVCEVYYGFIKNDQYVVERQNQFKERIDELADKRFLQNLQRYLDEGYKKDHNNYIGDDPVTPSYHSHKQATVPGMGSRSITPSLPGPKKLHKILANFGMQSVPLQNPPTP